MTSLNLQSNCIRDEGVAAIAEALQGNGVLKTLNLRNNDIGDAGATATGEALAVNAVLTDLNLRGNGIGDEGAKAIGEALAVNGVLNTLWLGNNNIGPTGATALPRRRPESQRGIDRVGEKAGVAVAAHHVAACVEELARVPCPRVHLIF